MHASALAELGATLAVHSKAIVTTKATSSLGLEQYWVASKCRLDNWGLALAMHQSASAAERTDHGNLDGWLALRPVIEEIFVSEMLTRIWTAVCTSLECPAAAEEAAPIAQNVLAGHAEASCRALKAVAGGSLSVEEAVSINRLRRSTERWNDLLLSLFRDDAQVESLAHNARRVRDFARMGPPSQAKPSVLMTSLRLSLSTGVSSCAANASTNRRIMGGVLLSLGAEPFGTTGLLQPAAMAEFYRPASDTFGRLEALLAADEPTDSPFTSRWQAERG